MLKKYLPFSEAFDVVVVDDDPLPPTAAVASYVVFPPVPDNKFDMLHPYIPYSVLGHIVMSSSTNNCIYWYIH